MKYFLTIDAGTTSVKVGLFRTDGYLKALSIQEYTLLTSSAGQIELPANCYWSALKKGVQEVLKNSKVDTGAIMALSISSQGETLIPINKKGQVLRNAIVWLDTRARTESSEISQAFSLDEFYHATGLPDINPMWPAAKVLWMRKVQPDIFKQTSKFLLLKDYLIYRLTGECVTDPTVSSSTGFLKLEERDWWDRMLEYIGINRGQLSRIVEPEEAVGKILPQVASDLGLSSNTLVIAGAMDQMAGAIAARNVLPGIVTETTGTCLSVMATMDKPIYDPNRRISCSPHIAVNKFFLMCYSETAGILLKWFRETFDIGKNEKKDYNVLVELAKDIPVGSEGLLVLPHFAGVFCPDSNPKARGAFVGLTLNHKKGHFLRALMESIAFMLKQNVELIRGLGVEVKRVKALGGAAKSYSWLQIKSDVLNLPVDLPAFSEAASVGTAILAGVGAGVYKDIYEGIEIATSIEKTIMPQSENVSIYEEVYQRYLDVYRRLYNKTFS